MRKILFQLFLLMTIPGIAQDISYKNGVVVSAHPIASEVGTDILKKDGNAIDAAVAVHFALSVTLPIAGNIGGGGFLVYRSHDGKYDALDYRETAPGKATEDMYLDKDGNPVEGLSIYGALAAGVPGSVDGMVNAHEKYGKLDWKELIQPAIDLAENGFSITQAQADAYNKNIEKFKKWNPQGIPFTEKEHWEKGDILVQKDLAKTLRLIRDEGRKGFYEGETAANILREMKEDNGLISAEDLLNYKSVWRKPVTGTYKNYKIISMPPPSSGGIALIALLHSVEPFNLKKYGFQHEKSVQVMTEAERRVYADRASHMGDPDFYEVPTMKLMDRKNIRERMDSFSFDQATPSSEINASILVPQESQETTHFSIVDKEGNAVSVTTTLNGTFGNYVLVEGSGFFLNNEMDDFSIKPGTPNMYGLTGGEANAIQPGKRMLSSMTPTIIEKEKKLFMVVGTPGGSTIITSVFQTFLNVVEFDKTLEEAVSLPRFHHQWLPDHINVEKGAIKGRTRGALVKKGYRFKHESPWGWADGTWGRVDAILVNSDGTYQGAADPRGDDTVSGY